MNQAIFALLGLEVNSLKYKAFTHYYKIALFSNLSSH